MTRVRVAVIADALRREGLLLSERGDAPQFVDAITDDSRTIGTGALFLAVKGTDRDGHEFLPLAEASGAAMVIVEDIARTALPAFVVNDSRRAAAVAAAAFYDQPARALRIVGVTGTNGKTTTVGMLRHLLDEPSARAASIGTLGVLIGSEGAAFPGGAGLTTPGPVELHRILRALVDAGVAAVAMEVSSHALHQHRVDSIEFHAAVFTNLTRDHLDYHGTMNAYFAAKALLVSLLATDGAIVVNADDRAWDGLPAAARTIRCGQSATADVRADYVSHAPRGSEWALTVGRESHPVQLPLIGSFNVANALAASGAALALGLEPALIAQRLSSLPQVPGRLEIISEHPTVLRDYAHTPDALERALDAVRPFTSGELIVVFGCGGDRDRGKRPEMGRIAELKADRVIVTSDNPRTENPDLIIDDIEAGMTAGRHERVVDRREAIARALGIAALADAPAPSRAAAGRPVILLAGKGHETYQIRGTMKFPFDERAIVQELRDGRIS